MTFLPKATKKKNVCSPSVKKPLRKLKRNFTNIMNAFAAVSLTDWLLYAWFAALQKDVTSLSLLRKSLRSGRKRKSLSTNTPDVFLLTLTWTASTRATNPNQQKLLSLRHHAERKLNSPVNVLARKAILMVCLFLFLSLTISAQQFAFDTRTHEAY